MKVNIIEEAVIRRFLQDHELPLLVSDVDFGHIEVAERNFTGMGFITEFMPSKDLKVLADGVSMRWGKSDARLNTSRMEAGFVVYVDDGILNAVEGFTYGGGDWPGTVDVIECVES